MKTIGLIGGMSWESTAVYYQKINQAVSAKLGALHSAKVVLWSVDFQEIETLQRQGQWQKAGEILAHCARQLEQAGAQGVLICTNTMHLVAEQVQEAVNIPLIHIADATAKAISRQGIDTVGLLGTAFTMEKPFYKSRLEQTFNLKVLVPETSERQHVHQIIYQELCLGEIKPASKATYLEVVKSLEQRGAQGIILGCTEIGLLISQQDSSVPLIDTVEEHIQAAVDFMLA